MTPYDYDYLCKLLKTRSGLMLSADKHYLVESRLLPVARKAGLFNLTGLVAKLRGPDCEQLLLSSLSVGTYVATAFGTGSETCSMHCWQ